jgi:hypothetical protein
MELALDPSLIDWHGRDGLHYRASLRDGVLVFKPRLRSLRDLVVYASGKANYYISKLLNQFWNATAFTFPATLYMALWTATLSASSTGSTAGEASYTGYARVAVTANTTNFPTSSGGGNIQNATAITFAANSGTAQTMTYFAVLDASTTGNLLFWGSITSTTINAGDTPQVNINGLTASEA